MSVTIDFVERYTDVLGRDTWPDGPWSNEPEDKVVWVDDDTDLDCMAVRNTFGAWCGYIGVGPGHRYHGVSYADVDAEVHGGLTFSDGCSPHPSGPQRGICHIEREDRPNPVWWLGFDCAHAWDLVPGMESSGRVSAGLAEYRDLAYVVGECRSLAAQVASD